MRLLLIIDKMSREEIILYGSIISIVIFAVASAIGYWSWSYKISYLMPIVYLLFLGGFIMLAYVGFFTDVRPIRFGFFLSALTGSLSLLTMAIILKAFGKSTIAPIGIISLVIYAKLFKYLFKIH